MQTQNLRDVRGHPLSFQPKCWHAQENRYEQRAHRGYQHTHVHSTHTRAQKHFHPSSTTVLLPFPGVETIPPELRFPSLLGTELSEGIRTVLSWEGFRDDPLRALACGGCGGGHTFGSPWEGKKLAKVTQPWNLNQSGPTLESIPLRYDSRMLPSHIFE